MHDDDDDGHANDDCREHAVDIPSFPVRAKLSEHPMKLDPRQLTSSDLEMSPDGSPVVSLFTGAGGAGGAATGPSKLSTRSTMPTPVPPSSEMRAALSEPESEAEAEAEMTTRIIDIDAMTLCVEVVEEAWTEQKRR